MYLQLEECVSQWLLMFFMNQELEEGGGYVEQHDGGRVGLAWRKGVGDNSSADAQATRIKRHA